MRSSPMATASSWCRASGWPRWPRQPKPASKKEEAKRKRLAAGELGLDIYGMRDALAKAGLEYVD